MYVCLTSTHALCVCVLIKWGQAMGEGDIGAGTLWGQAEGTAAFVILCTAYE